MRGTLVVLTIVLASSAPLHAQPTCPRATLPVYAHNDYSNRRPLFDALDLGYRGAEADVFLIDGELRLGHDRRAARRGATLEAQYLIPLSALVSSCGTLASDGQPFLLTVDLKEESRPAYDALVALLARYPALAAPPEGQPSTHANGPLPVEIVLVGWYPPPSSLDRSARLVRHERLRRSDEPLLETSDSGAVRLVSLDYGKTMGRWWVSAESRRRWLAAVRATKTAFPALRIRAHNVPVDVRVYRDLLSAGVDLIGTEQLNESAPLLTVWASP